MINFSRKGDPLFNAEPFYVPRNVLFFFAEGPLQFINALKRGGNDSVKSVYHYLLHGKGIKKKCCQLAPEGFVHGKISVAVPGQGMMNRRYHGESVSLHRDQSPSQGVHVMDNN